MKFALTLLALLFLSAGAWAQDYDGLTELGSSRIYNDGDAKMIFHAFHSKYKESLVGIYITEHDVQSRIYMNAAVWDKFKQVLIHARDNWETLQPREFDQVGTIVGYRVKNRKGTLRLSLMGETVLEKRRVLMSISGGAAKPTRTSISLVRNQVKDLVEDLGNIDAFFRNSK